MSLASAAVLITGLGSFLLGAAAIYKGRGENKNTGIDVGVKSLTAALARSDEERAELAAKVDKLEAKVERVIEHADRCDRENALLRGRVAELEQAQ